MSQHLGPGDPASGELKNCESTNDRGRSASMGKQREGRGKHPRRPILLLPRQAGKGLHLLTEYGPAKNRSSALGCAGTSRCA